MSQTLSLAGSLALDFLRHRLMVFLLLLFPLLIILMAVEGAPDQPVPLVLDGRPVTPIPAPEAIQVLSFSMTAVVLVGALTGFFTGFQLRSIGPRLEVVGLGRSQVAAAQTLVLLGVDVFVVVFSGNVSRFWVRPDSLLTHYGSLFLAAVLFNIIGLLLSRLVDTRAMGLNLLLALAVLDTAFLENPVLSRRFEEDWIGIMPAHRPVELLYGGAFAGQSLWSLDSVYVLAYASVLLLLLVAVGRRSRH